ncbi:MAG: hypothetical protein LPJ89_02430 [Hymenobacteraceae bacterium]|nr:hypothetical protein [Hymenobacteraceae bacterium]
MSLQQLIDSISSRIAATADVKTIYGQPIETQDKTIIPVAKVSYGFGGGAGHGKNTDDSGGIGCGGGVNVQPIGVIEVTAEETNFIATSDRRKQLFIALAGVGIGLFLGKKIYRKKEKKATDTYFSL